MLHEFLSKSYYFILSPFNWVILLAFIGFYKRKDRTGRAFIIAAVIMLVVFGNTALYNRTMLKWQPKPVVLQAGKYTTGVVLGGMSWVEEGEAGYFRNAADRFIQTVKLYKQGVIKKIIISAGGEANDQPVEAKFLVGEFIKMGVAKTDIIAESASGSTYENAFYSKRIIDSLHLQMPVVLITSAIHLYRADKTFGKAEVAVVAYPCDYDVVNVKEYFTDYFWPNGEVLDKWKYLLKEWIGIGYYRLRGWI